MCIERVGDIKIIAEKEKNEKNFIINIKLKNIDDPIDKILKSYNIKPEQFEV